MENKTLYTITIFSENAVGVLNQITTIFTRRQVNIETLSVSPSAIPGIHKFTITALSETEESIKKLVNQIDKQVDILKAFYNTNDELVHQELALYKLSTEKVLEHGSIEYLVRKYNIRVLEISKDCIVFLKAGHYVETQALFEELAEKIGVLQFVRSGRIAITKSPVERLSDMLAKRSEAEERIKESYNKTKE
ncbi:MAG TPA: acetolactate synthase small subunit [Dysgonamonadaceae bacterium]|jgi:acetolactate synthase-1/3 small subunit|nr:acetolactate synthase small subunit [Dysgonamonadaceae bacterium]MDK2838056.1 acetolactate synthase small subunit [Bacteroidota bacterium]MDN5306093.1 acetolactate synthase small subunit [Bacteroidota bacterium]HOM62689.1 acetolactate synthase small subunit [Dysgonamonadaceae bacterium]HOT65588.1 acetolactate synthase small subunit [Dysgonamonadaceae bacterium]